MLYTSQTSQGPRSFPNSIIYIAVLLEFFPLRPGAPTVPLPPYPQRPPGHPPGGVAPIPQLHFGATHGAYPTPVPMIPGMGGMGPPPIPIRPPTLSGYLSQTPPQMPQAQMPQAQVPQPQVPQPQVPPQAAQNVPPPQESPTSCAKDRTEGASNGERLGGSRALDISHSKWLSVWVYEASRYFHILLAKPHEENMGENWWKVHQLRNNSYVRRQLFINDFSSTSVEVKGRMSSKLLSLVIPSRGHLFYPFWEPTARKFNASNHGYWKASQWCILYSLRPKRSFEETVNEAQSGWLMDFNYSFANVFYVTMYPSDHTGLLGKGHSRFTRDTSDIILTSFIF